MNKAFGICAVAIASLFCAPVAQAKHNCGNCDDGCHKRKCPKGEVESLKPYLDWQDGQWCFTVRYKVEIKHARPGDQFELVFTPLRCDIPLYGSNGEPFTVATQLTIPQGYCDDKFKFCNQVTTHLSQDALGDACHIRVCGELIYTATGKVLDREREKVKTCGRPCVVVNTQVAQYAPPPAYFPPPAYAPPAQQPVCVAPPGVSRPTVIYQPYAASGPAPCPPSGYPINVIWNGGGVFVDPSCAYPFYRRYCWWR